MKLWQLVLKADDKLDLAKPKVGFAWFALQPWTPKSESGPFDEETFGVVVQRPWDNDEWWHNVMALRSLSARLMKRKPKHQYPDMLIARRHWDVICQRYIGMMQLRPVLRPRRKGERPGLTISAANLRGWRLAPTREVWWDVSVFWQCVFGSMIRKKLDPRPAASSACRRCCRALEPTTQGNPSRRETCLKCQRDEWWARRTPEQKRAKWARDAQRKRKAESS